jgi:hypothetical protein
LTSFLKSRELIFNFSDYIIYNSKPYAFLKKISPWYWFTRPMTKFMIDYFHIEPLTGVEIGVEYGLNAKTMLVHLPLEKLYLIDPYQDDDVMYREAKNYLARYEDKITFIRKTSEAAIGDIPDALDFVYIDGSHTYEAVKKDIELLYPKVRAGGVIGGHDFWANEIGVCRAVLKFAENSHVQLQGKLTDWWVVKQ